MSGALWSFLVIGTIVAGIYFSRKFLTDFSFESRYFGFIFRVLILYEIFMIIRGIPGDFAGIKQLLQSDIMIWPYIVPIFVFFDKRFSSLLLLMNAIYVLGILFLLTCLVYPTIVLYRSTAETFIHAFAFGCGFLLLNARYLAKKKVIVAFLSLLVGVLSFTYLARRNGMVSYVGLMLSALFLYLRNSSAARLFQLLPIFLFLGIFLVGAGDYLPTQLTQKFKERATEDTRSDLFDGFFKEMEDHMVVGKGMNGTYFFPINGGVEDQGIQFTEVQYRNLVENGYYQLLLNGGIVYIVLFVLTLLPAALLGIFKSGNQFSQACGFIILLWMIDMFIYGLPRLSLEYVLVWISAGVCYKPSIREMTNDEVSEAFGQASLV